MLGASDLFMVFTWGFLKFYTLRLMLYVWVSLFLFIFSIYDCQHSRLNWYRWKMISKVCATIKIPSYLLFYIVTLIIVFRVTLWSLPLSVHVYVLAIVFYIFIFNLLIFEGARSQGQTPTAYQWGMTCIFEFLYVIIFFFH